MVTGGKVEQMSLGDLIRSLSRCPKGVPCRVCGMGTTGLGKPHSYRGYYDHLALEFGAVRTVGEVYKDLLAARGSRFEGWKGGDYIMGDHTPVWVSNEGECSGLAVIGVLRPQKGSLTKGVYLVVVNDPYEEMEWVSPQECD